MRLWRADHQQSACSASDSQAAFLELFSRNEMIYHKLIFVFELPLLNFCENSHQERLLNIKMRNVQIGLTFTQGIFHIYGCIQRRKSLTSLSLKDFLGVEKCVREKLSV